MNANSRFSPLLIITCFIALLSSGCITGAQLEQMEDFDLNALYGDLSTGVEAIEKFGPPTRHLSAETANMVDSTYERALSAIKPLKLQNEVHACLVYSTLWMNRIHRDFIFLDKNDKIVSYQRVFIG